MANLDIKEIMENQPIANIGLVGHVSNGKSSLVREITATKTQRHSNEVKRNITIKLGYANAKIFKCSICVTPKCYQSFRSEVYDPRCRYCDSKLELITHVSFVDCPGHNLLMEVMLNGTCVMDSTILVSAANNTTIPAQQTREHVLAAGIIGLDNQIVCLNKIDLIKKKDLIEKVDELKEFLKCTFAEDSAIIPISANFGINIDVVCEYICKKIAIPKKDLSSNTKMIIIRSFNANKQGTNIEQMKGGVVGGTIMRGVLRVGDKIEILPGFIKQDLKKRKKKKPRKYWEYTPIISQVLSIQSEKNNLDLAIPGGLIGVQLNIDPAITGKDGIVGSVLRVVNEKSDEYHIVETLKILFEMIQIRKSMVIKNRDRVSINHNACNISCVVGKVKVYKEIEDDIIYQTILYLEDKPVCAQLNDKITISKINGDKKILIATAKIVGGRESIKTS